MAIKQNKAGAYYNEGSTGTFRRFTAFIVRTGQKRIEEEIDVDAVDIISAREIAEEALKEDYDPGFEVSYLRERFGVYF